jgi:hypothetical protein
MHYLYASSRIFHEADKSFFLHDVGEVEAKKMIYPFDKKFRVTYTRQVRGY